ncbi:MAG: hypothetical protein IT262_21855 [Saprospiraceae bacterium]|nr:hypothetical protein [Saprospiraceae bacterium]
MKLRTFSEFAATLLPQETAYLLSVQKFGDQVKLSILERLHENCRNIDVFIPYDEEIDKRKYSSLKNWITDRLRENDVDIQFEWMNEMERKIITDAIEPEEERLIFRTLKNFQPTHFFFIKFYELAQAFRHFLLIRLRRDEHRVVNEFLLQHQATYERSKQTYGQLHEATLDIVQQYATGSGESIQWQKWLADAFYDETLDGLNRYFALIRLIFVHLNYGRYVPLLEKFEYWDKVLERGQYYSKRLLTNYYSQRLLLHSKFKDYEKAAYYGYLSVRSKNSDYIFYVNNLAAVLLRAKRYPAALEVMKAAYPDVKTTRNFHNKIGFVAFYIKCLYGNRQYKNAESYAATFLKAYAKEVFAYRWHLFFSAYFEVLFRQGKFTKLLSVAQQYRLLERDVEYRKKSTYLPVIPWYHELANYRETGKGLQTIANGILQYILDLPPDSEKLPLLWEFLDETKEVVPDIHRFVVGRLHEKGRTMSHS